MSILQSLRQQRLLSINIAGYCFSPGLISSFITAFFLYVMISLGFWQLDRAEFKDTLQQKIEQRKNLAVAGIDELAESAEDRRFYPVSFTGEYDTAHTFLLDNKIFKGRVGYHVITPVKYGDNKAILVNRGFIKQGKTRESLPEIESFNGKITFNGLLDMEPSRGLVLAENVQDVSRWPVVLQYADIAELSQLLGYELYDMMLWLGEDEPGSYQYDLPALNLNSAKNNGYAFQWFALSFALLMIYIFVNTKRTTTI